MDVLGFGDAIKSTLDLQGKEVRSETNKIARLVKIFGEFAQEQNKAEFNRSVRVTQFSDSLVISFKINEESQVFYILLNILHLTIQAIGIGFFIRGGITVGLVTHTKKAVFGPAMVEAYRLESQKAKFPRVLLSEEIFKIAAKYPSSHGSHEELKYIEQLVKQDDDGLWYLDFFEPAFSELNDNIEEAPLYMSTIHKLITKGLQSSSKSVVEKYEWLKAKYSIVHQELTSDQSIEGWGKINQDVQDAFIALRDGYRF